jgi:hypothetical protein
MLVGADSFVLAMAGRTAPVDWGADVQELVTACVLSLERGTTEDALYAEMESVMQLGSALPELLRAVIPRHTGVPTTTPAPGGPPQLASYDSEVGRAWQATIGSLRGATALSALLAEGMRDVKLPGIEMRVALGNSLIYGCGCLVMATGIGMLGHVPRLAGALMAYMLFDHIGDGQPDAVTRRLVLREMMVFWGKGEWSSAPPAVVRRSLPRATRAACARAREWVTADRHPEDRLRSGERLGALAASIARDCSTGGIADHVDGSLEDIPVDALGQSLAKNVAAVAFLLEAFLNDFQSMPAPMLQLAGRAAAFAQLFDDLLDRDDDMRQGQRTAATALTDTAYQHMLARAAGSIPLIFADALSASPGMKLVIEMLDPAQIERWIAACGLTMHLMAAHRNPAACPALVELLGTMCRGVSPFVIVKAMREWLHPARACADKGGC